MSGSKTLNFGVIMKLKKYDIIAIICVAVIVIISYITVNLLRNDEADTVVIYVDGKIEKKLDLNKNQEYELLDKNKKPAGKMRGEELRDNYYDKVGEEIRKRANKQRDKERQKKEKVKKHQERESKPIAKKK